jgi:hypothetical protein
VLLLVLLAGCAPGANPMADVPAEEGEVAGFWNGLWHGIISPITFVISLFNDSVGIYEVHNNGGWYNFGFLFGVSITFGGSGGGACSGSRRRKRD